MGAVLLQQLRGFDIWLRGGVFVLAAILAVATLRALRRLGAGPTPVREIATWRTVLDANPVSPQPFRL
jgi:hypothetical protein